MSNVLKTAFVNIFNIFNAVKLYLGKCLGFVYISFRVGHEIFFISLRWVVKFCVLSQDRPPIFLAKIHFSLRPHLAVTL